MARITLAVVVACSLAASSDLSSMDPAGDSAGLPTAASELAGRLPGPELPASRGVPNPSPPELELNALAALREPEPLPEPPPPPEAPQAPERPAPERPAARPPDTGGDGLGPCGGDLPPCYVKARESGGNYLAKNPTSSASGAWQFLDSTWNGYGGYQRAMDAPPAVQDERARQLWAGGAGCSHWAAC